VDLNLNFGIIGDEINKVKPFDKNEIYDVIIVGGGPAGMTSAVYCIRKGLKTGILLTEPGGQVAKTKGIENYMGYKYIEGTELVDKFRSQVKQFTIAYEENSTVESLILEENYKKLETDKGDIYKAKTVILASGAKWKRLGIAGEKEFIGKGVGYCTTCDAPLFKDKKVVVVGGGNSGIEAAIDLLNIAESIKIVEFMPKLNADQVLLDKLKDKANVEIMKNSQVLEINGSEKVEKISVKNRDDDDIKEFDVDGVFIQIGLEPNSSYIQEKIELDKRGYIKVNCKCETNIEGVFAAGDVTDVMYNQIIIAAGEGAKAALSAYKYLMEN